jgi:hypothetical protein
MSSAKWFDKLTILSSVEGLQVRPVLLKKISFGFNSNKVG